MVVSGAGVQGGWIERSCPRARNTGVALLLQILFGSRACAYSVLS